MTARTLLPSTSTSSTRPLVTKDGDEPVWAGSSFPIEVFDRDLSARLQAKEAVASEEEDARLARSLAELEAKNPKASPVWRKDYKKRDEEDWTSAPQEKFVREQTAEEKRKMADMISKMDADWDKMVADLQRSSATRQRG